MCGWHSIAVISSWLSVYACKFESSLPTGKIKQCITHVNDVDIYSYEK